MNGFIFRYAIFLRHFPNGKIEAPQVNSQNLLLERQRLFKFT